MKSMSDWSQFRRAGQHKLTDVTGKRLRTLSKNLPLIEIYQHNCIDTRFVMYIKGNGIGHNMKPWKQLTLYVIQTTLVCAACNTTRYWFFRCNVTSHTTQAKLLQTCSSHRMICISLCLTLDLALFAWTKQAVRCGCLKGSCADPPNTRIHFLSCYLGLTWLPLIGHKTKLRKTMALAHDPRTRFVNEMSLSMNAWWKTDDSNRRKHSWSVYIYYRFSREMDADYAQRQIIPAWP